MRITGIILLSIIPLFIGIFKYSDIRKRLKRIEEMKKAAEFIKENIRYSAYEINEIFSLAEQSEMFSPEVKSMLKGKNNKNKYSDKECCYFAEYINGLGKSDVAGQLEHSNRYIKKFEEMYCELRADFKIKSRLYPGLGAGLATIVFLMLL